MKLMLMERESGLRYIVAVTMDDAQVYVWRPEHSQARAGHPEGHWSKPIPPHRRRNVRFLDAPSVVRSHIVRMPYAARPTVMPNGTATWTYYKR